MRFLIRDRGGQFTEAFDAVFECHGLRILRSPPQAPWANAIGERLIGTLRREVLDHLLIMNEAHLRSVLAQYAAHYNAARPHQGIGHASRMTIPMTRPHPSSIWTPHASTEDRSSEASRTNIRLLLNNPKERLATAQNRISEYDRPRRFSSRQSLRTPYTPKFSRCTRSMSALSSLSRTERADGGRFLKW